MKKNRKIFTTLWGIAPIVTSIPFVVLSCSESSGGTNSNLKKVNVISTNDIHGRMVKGNKDKEAGIDNISGWLKTQKYDLLLDGGDLIQGSALNDLDYGKTIAKIADIMGYDAIAVGNHEFDFGLDNILDIAKNVNQNYLSSNVRWKENDQRVFTASKIKSLENGLKVGIIGLTTEETAYKTHPKNVEKVKFTKILEETKKEVEELERKGINFITIVSHVGEYDTVPLAKALPNKIDLIIDGHSQIDFNHREGNTYIIQTGEYTNAVRKTSFDFNLSSGFIENFNSELVKAEEIIKGAENNISSKISELIKKQQTALDSEFSKVVIDNLPHKLNGERSDVRSKETNLGNLLTDGMVWKAKETVPGVDFAITNSGGIRASIEQGRVTKKQTYDVLPFGNTLIVLEMLGSDIKKIFDVAITKKGEGAFLQVSEEIKLTQIDENNWRYEIKNANGQFEEFRDGEKYQFATNDFVKAGGDGYDILKNATELANLPDLRYSFEEYLQELAKNNNAGFTKYSNQFPNQRWLFKQMIIPAFDHLKYQHLHSSLYNYRVVNNIWDTNQNMKRK